MSKALIVYGYYDEKDHYGVLLDAVKDQLKLSGVDEVEVTNTFTFAKEYAKNNTQDFSAPTAEWYRGHRNPENVALIKSEQDKILNSTHIIFIYPIWWESLPYYALSWVSEVFRSVSFRIGEGGQINPQWMGDRKVMIMTTAGFDQTTRKEYFEKMLPKNNLAQLKEKSDDEIASFMNMAQTYPLMTALGYSGLGFTEQCHICSVNKADDPRVLSAAREGIKSFLETKVKEAIAEVTESESPKQPSRPLLLSGGPRADTSTLKELAAKPEAGANDDINPDVSKKAVAKLV